MDAKATRITVEIQAGGRSLVRVTDDGVGMSRDDALLCLERHATSKIARAEDLSAVTTMGFRGEALPSIASVSRFSLTTREHDNDEGTQVVVNGGKIVEVRAAGCAPGTSVEVRQIFFNLPARRKFLRSEETESAHIQHYLTLAALASPGVAFSYSKDGRTVWQLPSVRLEQGGQPELASLKERFRALLGDVSLLPVDVAARLPRFAENEAAEEGDSALQEDKPVRIWGYIGAPGVSRSSRENQYIFVTRRPVENRGRNFGLLEGYHTALMKGRYPVCCLFLELNPAEVDVNIHPAKREVKFHRDKAIVRLVTQAVREALLDFHATPVAPNPIFAAQASSVSTLEKNPPVAPPLLELTSPLPEEPVPSPQTRELPNFPELSKPLANWPQPAPKDDKSSSKAAPASAAIVPFAAARSGLDPVPLLHVPLRVVGVIGRLYVILESDRGLVLLDQHAAHERILFEQMLRRLESQDAAPSQRLLLPQTIELTGRDALFLRQNLPILARLGVGLSEFGEKTFLLDALPPFVKTSEPRRYVVELIDELKAVGQGVNTLRLGEETIAKTVCRHSVKANDPLAGPELEKLVNDLRQCAMPYTCPHGRPTLIEMNYRELEKKFGRSQ